MTPPGSRTAAGSPTTSWTSSCASSPARCCPRPGRQADPARRRRRRQRQAVPADVPVRRDAARRASTRRSSGPSPTHAPGAPAPGLSRHGRGPAPPGPARLAPDAMTLTLAHPRRRPPRGSRSSPSAALGARPADRTAAPPAATPRLARRRAGASTDARIAALQRRRRARRPRRGRAATALADAYLQRARETGDPSCYARAERLAATARCRSRPRDAAAPSPRAARSRSRATTSARALRDARPRAAPRPDARSPYAVLVDAHVELGRYDEAARRAAARWSTASPTLAAYARVVLLARAARRPRRRRRGACASPSPPAGDAPENVAYVQTLLGDLELARGRTGAARARVRERARRASPATPPPQAGLARAAAPRAARRRAIARLRRLVARLPLPEHVVALGEVELAAGRARGARARPRPRRRRSSGCSAAPASTPTSSSRCSRPTTATARAACALARARLGARAERALGRRARLGADARRPPARGRCAGRAARCALGSRDPSVRSTTPAWRRAPRARRPSSRAAAARALRARGDRGCSRAARRARGRWRRCDEAPRCSLALALALARPRRAGARAHPLGNFSVNHLDVVRVSSDRVDVALRPRPGRDPDVPGARRGRAPRCCGASAPRSRRGLRADGRRRARSRCGRAGARADAAAPGRAGCARRGSSSRCARTRRATPRASSVRDGTFRRPRRLAGDRRAPGRGTAVRSSAPAERSDATACAAIRATLLVQPARRARRRRFDVRPGAGTLAAPRRRAAAAGDAHGAERRLRRAARRRRRRRRRPASCCCSPPFGWGALHALSPGHGKAMVAAYLVGTRGTAAARGRARRSPSRSRTPRACSRSGS